MASLALAALPFALVTFPPSVDLPQQAAQIRLLDELLGLSSTTMPLDNLEIRWWAPNNLVYAIFFLTARVLPPIAAARTALALLALAVVASVHELARRRDRPPEHAMLASTLAFSSSLYWGFVGFLLGASIFLLVLDRALRPPSPGIRSVAILTGLVTLLYAAHSLWLPMICVALVVGSVSSRTEVPSLRPHLLRLLAVAPALVHGASWFPRLQAERAASGFHLEARWREPVERLENIASADTLFGGLRGGLEPGMAALMLIWVLASFTKPQDREARGGLDRRLLAMAALLATFVVLAPDRYVNTIEFGSRFAFVAGILALLAVPRPPIRSVLARALPALAALAFFVTTTAAWVAFDRDELAGLEASIRVVPGPARVLGLDVVQRSEIVDGRPFLQEFAWRQAVYGGVLNFSFAEHRSGIVGAREPRPMPWTPGLEWAARRVTPGDLDYFDYALVGGTPEQQARFSEQAGTVMLVEQGRFRLHRLPGAVASDEERAGRSASIR